MIFQGIVFDDYVDDQQYNSFWANMCQKHRVEYKKILGKKATKGSCNGLCSVKDCQQEADYYVDFKPEEIVLKDVNLYEKRQMEVQKNLKNWMNAPE